jgi:hypothetical protein
VFQVTVSKDDTVILDGAGDKKALEERCEQVCVALLCYMQAPVLSFSIADLYLTIILPCILGTD